MLPSCGDPMRRKPECLRARAPCRRLGPSQLPIVVEAAAAVSCGLEIGVGKQRTGNVLRPPPGRPARTVGTLAGQRQSTNAHQEREMERASRATPDKRLRTQDVGVNWHGYQRRGVVGGVKERPMSSYTIRVPRVPVSKNGPDGYLRSHWTKRTKERDAWTYEIMAAGRRVHLPEVRNGEHRKVLIHQVRPRKFSDPDNLVGSCHVLLDSLVLAHYLHSDSLDFCEWKVTQEAARPKLGRLAETVITIQVQE